MLFMGRVFVVILVLWALIGFALMISVGFPRLVSITFTPTHFDQANAANIEKMVQLYMADQGLSAVQSGFSLTKLASGDNPYVEAKDLLDQFGRQFVIEVPGRNGGQFSIVSYGADGVVGGTGPNQDITSN